MQENKLKTITNLFEGKEIRSMWNAEIEDYYFSVVDVIAVLTDTSDARKYWSVLKLRLKKEGSELTTFCSQLKLKSKDGKYYKEWVDGANPFPVVGEWKSNVPEGYKNIKPELNSNSGILGVYNGEILRKGFDDDRYQQLKQQGKL